jgi:hypothetical protein
MKYKPLSGRIITLFNAVFVFAAATINVRAEEVAVVSPDKRWEYQGDVGIVKADTKESVLDLFDDQEQHGAPAKSGSESGARVIWAPDSRRFAFNYREQTPGAYYDVTTTFYQLRGDEWVRLRLPVDNQSNRGQLPQLLKAHFPKGDVETDILRVRNWTDANTAILYGYCQWKSGQEASFLFTLRIDPEGNSKIIESHRMSKEEAEAEKGKEPEGG